MARKKSRRRKYLTDKQVNEKYSAKRSYMKSKGLPDNQILPSTRDVSMKYKRAIVGNYGEKRGVDSGYNSQTGKHIFYAQSDLKKANKIIDKNREYRDKVLAKVGLKPNEIYSDSQKLTRYKNRGGKLLGRMENVSPDQFTSPEALSNYTSKMKKYSPRYIEEQMALYKENYIEAIRSSYSYNEDGEVSPEVEALINKIEETSSEEWLYWYLSTDESEITFWYSSSDLSDKIQSTRESLENIKTRLES